MTPTSIQASLNLYTVDDGIRPWTYSRPRTPSDSHSTDKGGTRRSLTVAVRNGRLHDLKLDQHSFELVTGEPTSLSTQDFFNYESVRDKYYEEIQRFVMRRTGAAAVVCFQHHVRSKHGEKSCTHPTHLLHKFNHGIHTDTSGPFAEKAYLAALQKLEMDSPGDSSLHRFRSGRFVFLNAWRNISDTNPIQNDHLACCDETSLIKPDDYIPSVNFSPSGHTNQTYSLNCRHYRRHRWYFFPNMCKNEILLFKQWDSDYTKPGRICFHTAFTDPTALAMAPSRQSIEVRMIAFFPDAAFNTCPSPQVLSDIKDSTGQGNRQVTKG